MNAPVVDGPSADLGVLNKIAGQFGCTLRLHTEVDGARRLEVLALLRASFRDFFVLKSAVHTIPLPAKGITASTLHDAANVAFNLAKKNEDAFLDVQKKRVRAWSKAHGL